jgi:hypothetical protein
MAKLEEARSKRSGEAVARESAVFGTAGLMSLDPLLQASNRLFEGWMAVNNEILEFGKTRFDRSLEISKAMAQSTSLSEAIDLQANYTRSIVNDYVNEAHKIVDLGARSLLDSFTTLQQQAREKATQADPFRVEAAE